MTTTAKTWPLASYTAGAWTDAVVGDSGGSTVRSVVLANTTVADISASVRIASSDGVAQSILLPPSDLAAGASYLLDIPAINLSAGQKLQVSCAAVGIELTASGISY